MYDRFHKGVGKGEDEKDLQEGDESAGVVLVAILKESVRNTLNNSIRL